MCLSVCACVYVRVCVIYKIKEHLMHWSYLFEASLESVQDNLSPSIKDFAFFIVANDNDILT